MTAGAGHQEHREAKAIAQVLGELMSKVPGKQPRAQRACHRCLSLTRAALATLALMCCQTEASSSGQKAWEADGAEQVPHLLQSVSVLAGRGSKCREQRFLNFLQYASVRVSDQGLTEPREVLLRAGALKSQSASFRA